MTKDGPVLDTGAPPAASSSTAIGARTAPTSGMFKMTKDGPVLISATGITHTPVGVSSSATATPSGSIGLRPSHTPHTHAHHGHHGSGDSSISSSSSSHTGHVRPESGRWDAAKLLAAKREAKAHAAAVVATAALTQTEWVERQLELRSKEFTDDKKITM
jgi:hypothetical protein